MEDEYMGSVGQIEENGREMEEKCSRNGGVMEEKCMRYGGEM